jgi:hypothetical protein
MSVMEDPLSLIRGNANETEALIEIRHPKEAIVVY